MTFIRCVVSVVISWLICWHMFATYESNFVEKLRADTAWVTTTKITANTQASFQENIKSLLYPTTTGGSLRNFIRVVWFILLIIFIFYVWIDFITNVDNEANLKKARDSLLYIAYWSILFFGALWFVWNTDITNNSQTVSSIIWRTSNTILSNLIVFLKAAAYLFAIVMIVRRGFEMIRAYEKEDKFNAARSWVINVLWALALIKVVDFIFLISSQSNFKAQITEFILNLTKLVWYGVWVLFVLYLIYAWALLATSWWDDKSYEKAINYVKAIAVIWVLLILFLLFIYQILNDLQF